MGSCMTSYERSGIKAEASSVEDGAPQPLQLTDGHISTLANINSHIANIIPLKKTFPSSVCSVQKL